MSFSFEYTYPINNSRARLGKITTPHGVIETPAFIFCATKAAIKGLTPAQMKEAGTQIILANTYHLMIQPGAELIKEMGGLHRFMGWQGPMLTDSGGFQIFSLGHGSVAQEIKGNRNNTITNKSLVNITEEGAIFKSYLDGKKILLTPEKSIEVQRNLGVDLIVVLDECTPFHVDKAYTRKSMEMSHRWATRSYEEFKRYDNGSQSLYGIIQGGIYDDLRKESCDFVNQQPFFGHAIGGSLGANKEQMSSVIEMTTNSLDSKRPIHLLGIGGIQDIINGVNHGIDTFDCVHPTRIARHGGALVRGGDENGRDHINLYNSKYKLDQNPIEDNCHCYSCRNFSRSYLRHLLKAQELLAIQLITMHNVHFMNKLMHDIRAMLRAKTHNLDLLHEVAV